MIVVLGAGITGLTIAYYLKKAGREVLLLEKENVAGGKIKSFKEKDLVGELGPNTILLNNLEFKKLLEDLNLYEQMIFPDEESSKKRFILYKGKPEAVPRGPLAFLKSPLIGISSLKKIIKDQFLPRANPEKESFANLCRRHFGEEIYQNLITPIITGIYAGDPEKMDADYVLPMLKEADRKEGAFLKNILKNLKKKSVQEKGQLPGQKMFSFENGLQTLPLHISKELGNSLLLNSNIDSITSEEGKYKIVYLHNNKKKEIEAKSLISTIPTSALVKINNNLLLNSVEKIQQIPYVPICVLHLAFEKSSVGFKEKAFGLLSRPKEKTPFLGILFNSRIFPHTAPAHLDLFTVICGGALHKEITLLNDEELLNKVLSSIHKILNISSSAVFSKITRWQEGIPQYNLGYEEILKTMRNLESQHPHFHLTGNYRNGVSVSDCVKNAFILAQRIIKET